jgi:hypothetical protein
LTISASILFAISFASFGQFGKNRDALIKDTGWNPNRNAKSARFADYFNYLRFLVKWVSKGGFKYFGSIF